MVAFIHIGVVLPSLPDHYQLDFTQLPAVDPFRLLFPCFNLVLCRTVPPNIIPHPQLLFSCPDIAVFSLPLQPSHFPYVFVTMRLSRLTPPAVLALQSRICSSSPIP